MSVMGLLLLVFLYLNLYFLPRHGPPLHTGIFYERLLLVIAVYFYAGGLRRRATNDVCVRTKLYHIKNRKDG